MPGVPPSCRISTLKSLSILVWCSNLTELTTEDSEVQVSPGILNSVVQCSACTALTIGGHETYRLWLTWASSGILGCEIQYSALAALITKASDSCRPTMIMVSVSYHSAHAALTPEAPGSCMPYEYSWQCGLAFYGSAFIVETPRRFKMCACFGIPRILGTVVQ